MRASSLILYSLVLVSACTSKSHEKNQAQAASPEVKMEVPKLEIQDDVTLELVSGTSGGYTLCKNEKGEDFSGFDTSDVRFRIKDGYLEKEENVGCPTTVQNTRKPLTDQMRSLLNLALEEMKTITVETKEPCIADGTYAGVRLLDKDGGKQFVYLIPKSKITCLGDFVSIADWESILFSFESTFIL